MTYYEAEPFTTKDKKIDVCRAKRELDHQCRVTLAEGIPRPWSGCVVPTMPGDEPPLVLVSGYPPSTAFGGGIVLRRLLEGYPRDRLTVVTSQHVADALAGRPDGGGLLPSRHVLLAGWRSRWPGLRRLARSANVLRIPRMAGLIRRELRPGSALLAVPWGGELGSELFTAAYLAHRTTRRPLLVYEMDEWRASLGTASGRVASALERMVHGRLLRAAATVWTMTEPMAQELASRFGVEARVLPHCVDLARYAAAAERALATPAISRWPSSAPFTRPRPMRSVRSRLPSDSCRSTPA